MTSDRDRKRAFAVCAVVVAAVVAALSLLGRDGATEPAGSPPRALTERIVGAPTPSGTPAPSGTPTPSGAAAPDADASPLPKAGASPVLPAGQAPEPGGDAPPQTATGPAAAEVRAVARRFVEAYLVYELGRPAPAQRRALEALSGESLRDELLGEPPRVPLGEPLERGSLSSIDGVAAAETADPASPDRFDVTYTVRRGGRYELHAIEIAEEDERWRVARLVG